ncbi:MAG: fibrobacter succinogenes major paralogous domain-containing protein, partial [Dysgonamonadaceae bacterium]|nr:fibrobacter succinogenes major paralogous domain-containing protein [Dysgonamonadaceae bacterium]
AGQSAQTLDIAQPGFYKAEAINGSCVSARSLAKNISTVSGAAAVTISGAQTGNPGDIITFTAAMNNPQGASYAWTASSPAVVQGLSSGSQFVVSFPTDGSYTVSLVASNACGTASVTNNNYPVTIAPACNSASILSHSPASKSASTVFNVGTSISITAAGSPTLSYQWYSSTTASNRGGTPISGATSAIYNTDKTLAEGIYYYYCEAASSCDNSTATSDVFTLTVNPNAATLPTGAGALSGRVCFDVAQSNDGGDCGGLAGRQAETLTANGGRADFTNSVTNTQTYTYTPSGTVSNVRFVCVEASAYTGKIIESVTGGNAGNSISSAVACTVVYKSGLNDDAKGKTTADALTVDIYAIYNDGATNNGTDKAVKLTVSIKDCACCGAYTTSGTWLNFMCYNLGADPTIATPAAQQAATPTTTWTNSDGVTTSRVYGNYYQWGNNLALASTGTDNNWVNATTTTAGTPGYFNSSYNNAWGNSGAKTANDPCPAGWRVPSITQWQSLANGNTSSFSLNTTGVVTTSTNKWTWKAATTKGVQIGNFLFLPVAGYRKSVSSVSIQGTAGYYWSRTPNGTGAYRLYFASTVVYPADNSYRYYGLPVRCVEE